MWGKKALKYIAFTLYHIFIEWGPKKENMKLIAKTQKELEFMHSRNDSFFAPNSSAQKMCDILNKNKYHINNDNETWDGSHKVLNIIEKNTLDHKNGFSVDIVTRKICG